MKIENSQLKIGDAGSRRRVAYAEQFSIFNFQFSIFNLFLIFMTLLSSGCGGKLPGKPDPKDRPVPAERVLTFNELYSRNCAGCHGADGTHGAAPPLNDPLFRALISRKEIEDVLKYGRAQGSIRTQMAPFAHDSGGPLSFAQVQVLARQIKGESYELVEEPGKGTVVVDAKSEAGIEPVWGQVPAAPATTPPFTLPKEAGDVARGKIVFANACASCHGDNGEGELVDGHRLKKINDVAFLSLISDQELRRIIITGRADLKMPNYAQKTGRPDDFKPLTAVDVNDLGALLAEWRKGSR